MNDDLSKMNLKTEDTVVINLSNEKLIIIVFLEAIREDEKNYNQAVAGVNKCFNLINKKHINSPINIIVDLRQIGNQGYISPKAKNVYLDFVADSRINKVAVLGSSDTQAFIAKFILSFDAQLKEKFSWFSEEIEAKFWLDH